MLSLSRKVSRLSLFFWPRKASPFYSVAGQNHFSYLPFSTIRELPDWVKDSDYDNPSINVRDGDFGVPKIAKLVDSPKLHGDRSKRAADIVGRDLNKVSGILKGKFNSINAVVRKLSECDQIKLSETLVEKVLLRFSHDWIPAFGFFTWAKPRVNYTAKCYDMMVDILGRSKNFDLMWKLVEEMNELGGLISFSTMTKVIRRLAKWKKYDAAIEAFYKFECFGVVRKTAAMNMLMKLLVQESNVELAQKVYLEFKDNLQPNDLTFNILIHGFCKAKLYSEAKKVMADMEKHGFQPDLVSYTYFIEYYCREKAFRKVDGILEHMELKGYPPNVVIYTIVVRALGEAKKINEALGVYHKMKQNGCVPDASFYSALIYILSKSGRFKDACDLFEDMPKDVRGVLTYNTIIGASCSHSREEYALELLKEMIEKSFIPNLNTYMPLLKMCCEKKRMKLLNDLLADMFKKNVSLDLSAHCLLVDQLCKSGELEHACSLFEQMVSKGMVPRNKTYTLLIGKLEQNRMGKVAKQIEKLMLKAK